MVNAYGFDSYGTDVYTRSQGGIWLNERTSTTRPREIINFTELESQNQMLKQYVKLNGDGLYEVKIPGKPTTVFYNEADAINNCRYQLTNTSVTSLGGNATGAPRTTTRVPNSAVYPNANGAEYARMLEQNPLPPQNVDVVGNTPAGNTSKTLTPEAQQGGNTPANTKPSRAERLAKIRSNPEARARYNRLKLRNNPELKARYERFSKFKKMKGLKKAGGKLAIAALVIGAGALLLNKCSGSEKAVAPVNPTESTEQPEQNEQAEQTEPTTPVTPAPGEPDESTTPAEPETPVTPVPVQPEQNEQAEQTEPTTPAEPETPVTPVPVQPEQPVDVSGNIIQNGDTLETVANRYGVTIEQLKELNADKIRQFQTINGQMVEGFRVGEDITLPEGTQIVEGLRTRNESISDYEEALIRNFDSIPESMWNQVCTPEFREKHKLGEYKEAA